MPVVPIVYGFTGREFMRCVVIAVALIVDRRESVDTVAMVGS